MIFWLGCLDPARAENPAAPWFGSTMLCRALVTGASCALWLQPDGRYMVFYDSGKPAFVTGVGGAFRYEARQGRYTARPAASGFSLCLSPDVVVPPARFSRAPDLFHQAGCVALPRLAIGQVAALNYLGRAYILALVRNR